MTYLVRTLWGVLLPFVGVALAPGAAAQPLREPPAVVLAQGADQGLVPLEVVLSDLRKRYSGHKLDARINDQAGMTVYEIKWLTADGRKLHIFVDARTGAILGTEGFR